MGQGHMACWTRVLERPRSVCALLSNKKPKLKHNGQKCIVQKEKAVFHYFYTSPFRYHNQNRGKKKGD